ncbi:Protein required for attachment to host cells [Solimonas aquatica]|uniref:Protein required for attachment to host cells n=1 Tax=Solimonas aquatica TaxID=489703 RepID=A0A1H9LVI0_9GAMM|nr:host attachment protein [Solimonas aquatica]SER15492.1 Protein required for attachment to host cells [Solimonas aquatica]
MPRQYTHKPGTPQHPSVWVVVADAGCARLLQQTAADGELCETADLINADARRQPHEVQSDRPGHGPRVGGGGGVFESPQSYAEHTAETFAKRVGEHLNQARARGEITRLYLIAAPAFLGRLRPHLDESTHRLLAGEQDRDLTHCTLAQIRAALPEQL